MRASIRHAERVYAPESGGILVIPPALAQFWRFARRDVGTALEGAPLPGHALLLNDGRRTRLRDAEAAQRIVRKAERQLARAHDREANPLAFEMSHLGIAVGPDRGVDFRIELARDLDDAPRLEALRGRDHEQPRLGNICCLQNTGGRCFAIDGRNAALAQSLDAAPILFDD